MATKTKPKTAQAPWEAMGFVPVPEESPKNLIVAISGHDKTGKTHFCMTAPDPIVVFSLDLGLRSMVEKFKKAGKKIYHKEYVLDLAVDAGPDDTQKEAKVIWDQMRSDFEQIPTLNPRTVVVDSATEMWEIARLAAFGSLLQIQPWFYPKLNTIFRRVLRVADRHPEVNFIYTQKMAEIWDEKVDSHGKRQSYNTGEHKPAGFKDMKYVAQVNVQTFKEGGRFGLEVTNCRQEGELEGLRLIGKQANFAGLATSVFPDADPATWE